MKATEDIACDIESLDNITFTAKLAAKMVTAKILEDSSNEYNSIDGNTVYSVNLANKYGHCLVSIANYNALEQLDGSRDINDYDISGYGAYHSRSYTLEVGQQYGGDLLAAILRLEDYALVNEETYSYCEIQAIEVATADYVDDRLRVLDTPKIAAILEDSPYGDFDTLAYSFKAAVDNGEVNPFQVAQDNGEEYAIQEGGGVYFNDHAAAAVKHSLNLFYKEGVTIAATFSPK